MNRNSIPTSLVAERKYQAGQDALADAEARGFTAEQTRNYVFDAQSNAIWDAQQGRPYKKPSPPLPPSTPHAAYTELGFLNGMTPQTYTQTQKNSEQQHQQPDKK